MYRVELHAASEVYSKRCGDGHFPNPRKSFFYGVLVAGRSREFKFSCIQYIYTSKYILSATYIVCAVCQQRACMDVYMVCVSAPQAGRQAGRAGRETGRKAGTEVGR